MIDRVRLHRIIAADMARPARPDAVSAGAAIAARYGRTVAAVLFYGSALRSGDPGIVDLYVLVDDYRAFHGNILSAAANRLLPPTVQFLPANADTNIGFKVAVISRRQFRARMRPGGIDSTLWARFCQSSLPVYCRDEAVRAWLIETLAEAAKSAVRWAVRFGPAHGRAGDAWTALFRQTYGNELRVETATRAETIYRAAARRFDDLLEISGVDDMVWNGDGGYRRLIDERKVAAARRAWNRRRLPGKVLNLVRLAKALFTFVGGVDYIVWKLERHSGQKLMLTPWQRRHPLLATATVLPALLRRGIVR
jgi:hypothetical protein